MSLQSIILRVVPILLPLVLIYIIVYAIKFFKSNPEKKELRTWYKKRLWKSGGFGLLLVVLWFLAGLLGSMMGISVGASVPTPSVPTAGYSTSEFIVTSQGHPTGAYISSQPVYNNNQSIADTRSFEKMTYSGNIKTRHVEDVAQKVKLLIKGVSGRIDSYNVSENYASFSFVIPKTEYDDFEKEIRTYTHVKLYSQSISSYNKLSEKQALERNQGQAKETIAALSTQQQKIKDDYAVASKALKSQIALQNKALQDVEAKLNLATTSEQIIPLQQTAANLASTINALQNNLNNLTATFKTNMTNLGASLAQQDQALSDLSKATEDFLNDVETVQGSLSISYVSAWELINIFSPVDPAVAIGVIIFLLYVFNLYRAGAEEKRLLEA